MYRPWVELCQVVTISPKPPSSGMVDKLDFNVLNEYAQIHQTGNSLVAMKVVIFDIEDLMFAREIFHRYRQVKPFLSVGTPLHQPYNATRLEICRRTRWLFEEVLKYDDLVNATVLPQLHTLAWGSKKGV